MKSLPVWNMSRIAVMLAALGMGASNQPAGVPIQFNHKTPVRFTGRRTEKRPGRGRPAKGYDPVNHCWLPK
jgi:hypothetical protein